MKNYQLICPECNHVHEINSSRPISDSIQIQITKCQNCSTNFYYHPKIQVSFASFKEEREAEASWQEYIELTYRSGN